RLEQARRSAVEDHVHRNARLGASVMIRARWYKRDMQMVDVSIFNNDKDHLIIPPLAGFYDRVAQPMAWSIFRLAVGGMLVVEGWPKILAPLAQVGFVENLGFYPGWLWSPLLAVMQVFGGLMIALGLFTRPAALANGVMLAITLWFHYIPMAMPS
ncbi:DoxX family protein, partial [Rhizobium sp. RU36D]|uniref:DoxX family protein n=1 Tax=Rhizobium sp. RU36D TaxID=1907415 RepID=UPI001FCCF12D